MSAVCIVLAIGMYLLIQKTRLGMTIRAGAANREMVQSLALTSICCTGWCSRWRGAGRIRRHDRSAGGLGVPGMAIRY